MTDLAGKRIAVYARFSDEKQNASSCTDQIAKCARFVRERGGEIDPALVFRDDAISGTIRERPGLLALASACSSLDVVIVEHVDRLSRDTEDSAWIRRRIPRLIAIDNGIDTASEGASFTADIFAAVAAQIHRDIGAKTRRGMEGRARAGKATGGLAYGFRSVPGPEGASIEVDRERAAIVVGIFEAFAAGASLHSIAADLNRRGISPPRAHGARSRGEWLHTTVRSILRNERYTGRWAYGRTVWGRDPDTRRRTPRKLAAPVHIEERPELAIVDAELWARVLARFAQTKTVFTGRRTVPAGRMSYPLSGILHCGACGSTMTITGGEADRRYYGCTAARRGTCDVRHHHRESLVRERVLGGIRTLLHAWRPELERAIAEEWAATRLDDERAELVRRIEHRERGIRRAVDYLLEGDSAAVRDRLTALEAAQRADRAALARVVAASDMAPTPPTADEAIAAVEAMIAGPAAEARAALRDLLDGGRLDVLRRPDGLFEARGGVLPPIGLGAVTGVDCGGRKVTPVTVWPLVVRWAA